MPKGTFKKRNIGFSSFQPARGNISLSKFKEFIPYSWSNWTNSFINPTGERLSLNPSITPHPDHYQRLLNTKGKFTSGEALPSDISFSEEPDFLGFSPRFQFSPDTLPTIGTKKVTELRSPESRMPIRITPKSEKIRLRRQIDEVLKKIPSTEPPIQEVPIQKPSIQEAPMQEQFDPLFPGLDGFKSKIDGYLTSLEGLKSRIGKYRPDFERFSLRAQEYIPGLERFKSKLGGYLTDLKGFRSRIEEYRPDFERFSLRAQEYIPGLEKLHQNFIQLRDQTLGHKIPYFDSSKLKDYYKLIRGFGIS